MENRNVKRPPSPGFRSAATAGGGAAIAIAVVAGLGDVLTLSLIMAPLGASCFLAFALPESPLAQPRHIVFGHVISTAAGLLVLQIAGPEWWATGLAVGLAVMVMMLARVGHPPAGADPIVVMALQPGIEFLILPVLAGSLIVVGVAVIFNRMRRDVDYPVYW